MKWLPTINRSDIQLFKAGKDKFDDNAVIFILSYDLATRRAEELAARNFKAAIADETHYLKSRDAKRSKVLCPILTRAKRCILISGTPMLARPVEVFNLLKVLRPDVFHVFKDFVERYCAPKQGRYGMDYSGNTCTAELHYVLHKNLMIRRLKADVLHELPAKRRQKIQISVDDKIVKKILKILSEMGEPKGDEDEHKFYGINGMSKPVSFDDALDEM